MPTLYAFDRELNETIVKRGRDYFRKERVQDLEEVDDGVWRALVEGSEVYDTTVTIKEDEITKHRCSCPYDLGEFCKHEIALLYAIKQYLDSENGDEDGSLQKRKGAGTGPRLKRKTVKDRIDTALDAISPDVLRQIVLEHAQKDRVFRSLLLHKAPLASGDDLKEMYVERIRSSMAAAGGRNGDIGYWETSQAIVGAEELLQDAKSMIERKEYETAFVAIQALLESLYPALQEVDDSNGEFGGSIEETWSLFHSLAESIKNSEGLVQSALGYCLKQAPRKMYKGWSADHDFFRVAATLVETDEQQQDLFKSIDHTLARNRKEQGKEDDAHYLSDYDQEKLLEIKLGVLKKRGSQEADAMLKEHLSIPSFREIELERLMMQKEYKEAKWLAEEGVDLAVKKSHGGTARNFEEWIVRIAEQEGDVRTMQKLLKKFFLSGHTSADYERLKRTYAGSAKEWSAACEEIVASLKKQHDIHVLLDLYIAEYRWGDFLTSLLKECRKKQKNAWEYGTSIAFLEHYEKVMREHFPDQLIKLYAEAVPRALLASASGRTHYQYVCRALRRMRKWGAEEIVKRIKDDLCKKYSNRRALLDELSKV